MMWNLCSNYAVLALGMFSILRFVLAPTPLFSQELQWKVLGHLEQPRTEFGIAMIGNGKVIVVGGFVKQRGVQKEMLRGAVTAECEIIDVKSRSIISAPSMNVPHARSIVLQTVDSNIVAISGLNTDSTTTPICEMFDHKKNVWRVLGSLLIGRHCHMASFINQEEIMVVGGRANYNYAGTIAEAEIFNIRTGKSRMVSDFPCKVDGGISFVSESRHTLFFIGRSNGASSYRTSNVYSYDSLRGCWVCIAYLPDAVHESVGKILFDARLIFAGGLKGESRVQKTISPYIRIGNQTGFVVVGEMIQPRWASLLEQWNSEIIINMGGVGTAGSALNHTEWFDLRTKQSFEGPPMKEPRLHSASASFPIFDSQGKQQRACVIVVGGINIENKSLSSVEILETTNPQLIELPSTEIASRRRQQLLTSPAVIITLTAFILVLIAALLYLLYQVFIIRKQTKFSLIDGASEGQKI
ncbi:MAG: hypothetical protein H9535_08580 [Ignavibacteria bacterium]|nr:hypothetical protein [Ignavibacteria bacterium]